MRARAGLNGCDAIAIPRPEGPPRPSGRGGRRHNPRRAPDASDPSDDDRELQGRDDIEHLPVMAAGTGGSMAAHRLGGRDLSLPGDEQAVEPIEPSRLSQGGSEAWSARKSCTARPTRRCGQGGDAAAPGASVDGTAVTRGDHDGDPGRSPAGTNAEGEHIPGIVNRETRAPHAPGRRNRPSDVPGSGEAACTPGGSGRASRRGAVRAMAASSAQGGSGA